MADIDLSICIVTWNSVDLLPALLDSLPAAAEGLTYEVLVADNASEDGIAEFLARRYPAVDLVRNDVNRYFTFATNQNLRRARGRLVVTINPDSVAHPGAFARMAEVLDGDPAVGAVGPLFRFVNGQDRVSFCRAMTRRWFLQEATGINAVRPEAPLNRAVCPVAITYPTYEPRDVEGLYGACYMVRREVIDRVGVNDEALVHGFDEYDYCMRIARAGWRVRYEPRAVVMHVEGASRAKLSPAQSAVLTAYHWAGLRRIAEVHFGRPFALLYRALSATVRPPVVFAHGVWAGLRRRAGRARRTLAGRRPAPTR